MKPTRSSSPKHRGGPHRPAVPGSGLTSGLCCRAGQRLPVDRPQRQDVREGLQVDRRQPHGEARATDGC